MSAEQDAAQNLYNQVRRLEGRRLSDAEVFLLPRTAASHPRAAEWKIRAASARKVRERIAELAPPRTVLDVGCGNGWFSHYLAQESGTTVWGVDPNAEEIDQASRVFRGRPNLRFIEAEILDSRLDNLSFDAVVFGSSLQYFPSLGRVLSRADSLLDPGGVILVFDTPFYGQPAEREAAAERSRAYYSQLGVSSMAQYYHHHTLNDVLAAAKGKTRVFSARPASRWTRLLGTSPSPFPRIEVLSSRYPR